MELLQPSFLILLNAFLNAYPIVAIILLLITAVKRPYRNEAYNLLYVYNTIIPWVYLVGWIYLAVELFLAWYGQNPYEWYAFNERAIASNVLWWVLFILHSLVPMLFLIRFLRTNRLFILFYIILIIILNYERIIILITSYYRDYLPSSWSTSKEKPLNNMMQEWAFCAIIFCGIYWLLNKRKKLPYPSLFLK